MGGYGAMHSALAFPERFGYVGSFSAMYRIEDYLKDHKSNLQDQNVIRTRADLATAFGEDFGNLESGNLHKLFIETLDKTKLPKVYLSCGTQDPLLPLSRRFHKLLQDNSFEHVYEEWTGNHEWEFWGKSLERMLEVFLGVKS